MGAAQSTAQQEPTQRLLETLRAMDHNKTRQQADMSEKDYVLVQNKSASSEKPRDAASKDVSISSTQQWEKELLRDPKVYLSTPTKP